MNPWALVIIGIGILLIIIGIKGSQHNIASAIVNKPSASTQKTTGTGPAPRML